METMTREHPRWEEFIERLFSGRNETWCEGNFKSARIILLEMGEIDIDESLAYCKRRGGYCDCEILYNIVQS